jgi:hypothetical protein
MPIPSSIADLSTTASANSPAGSESPGLIDDYLRTYASYIALLRDRTGPTASLAIGPLEINALTPFIDFHFNNTVTDYNVRLINSASGTLEALVTNANEFRINGFTAWNDSNCGNKLGSIAVGGVGSYGFFLTNTGLTPGATTAGGNLQYAFAVGNGGTSPTGLWRCMGDTIAGGRTLFQRIS